MNRSALLLPLALLTLCSASCFDPADQLSPGGLSTMCVDSSQCAAGLACLDADDYYAESNDSGCKRELHDFFSTCSTPCDTDSDCLAFGGECVRYGCDAGQPGLCSAGAGVGPAPWLLDGGLQPPVKPQDAGTPVDAADAADAADAG